VPRESIPDESAAYDRSAPRAGEFSLVRSGPYSHRTTFVLLLAVLVPMTPVLLAAVPAREVLSELARALL
jgi:hypothetical protein